MIGLLSKLYRFFRSTRNYSPILWHRWLAIAGVTIVFVWLELFGGWDELKPVLHGNRGQVYSTLASLYGSLAGFVLSSLVFAVSVIDRPKLAAYQRSGHSETLFRVYHCTIIYLGFAALVAVVCLLFDRDNKVEEAPLTLRRALTYPLLFFTILAVLSLNLLAKSLRGLHQELHSQ